MIPDSPPFSAHRAPQSTPGTLVHIRTLQHSTCNEGRWELCLPAGCRASVPVCNCVKGTGAPRLSTRVTSTVQETVSRNNQPVRHTWHVLFFLFGAGSLVQITQTTAGVGGANTTMHRQPTTCTTHTHPAQLQERPPPARFMLAANGLASAAIAMHASTASTAQNSYKHYLFFMRRAISVRRARTIYFFVSAAS